MSLTDRLTRTDAGGSSTSIDALTPDADGTAEFGEFSGAALNAIIFDIETSGYATWSVWVKSAGTSNNLLFETSEDRVNWVVNPFILFSSPNAGVLTSPYTAAANSVFMGPGAMKYLRCRISSYTSGTVTVVPRLLREARFQFGGLTMYGAIGVTPNANANYNSPSISRINSAASINATSLKATAANVFALNVHNTSAATKYLKLYNKAAAPAPASDAALLIHTVVIPANGFVSLDFGSMGVRFPTGLAYAITNLLADTDATAVGAGEVTGSIGWT